jgi:hypothetical protein
MKRSVGLFLALSHVYEAFGRRCHLGATPSMASPNSANPFFAESLKATGITVSGIGRGSGGPGEHLQIHIRPPVGRQIPIAEIQVIITTLPLVQVLALVLVLPRFSTIQLSVQLDLDRLS